MLLGYFILVRAKYFDASTLMQRKFLLNIFLLSTDFLLDIKIRDFCWIFFDALRIMHTVWTGFCMMLDI